MAVALLLPVAVPAAHATCGGGGRHVAGRELAARARLHHSCGVVLVLVRACQ